MSYEADVADHDRRRFVGGAALTLAAAGFGVLGAAWSGLLGEASASVEADGQFDGANEWLNSPPLTPARLRGKVVLVNFWTYTCINWLRQLPYVRAWEARYKNNGLVVIGVHTPEFPFEHNVDQVKRAAKAMRVEYPIAIDNDYAVWRAFDNHYWPALYLLDAKGRQRHQQFGEGGYEESERMIQRLLADAGTSGSVSGTGGGSGIARDLVSVEAGGVEAPADWDSLRSPENYVGHDRTENFESPGGTSVGKSRVYSVPARLSLNHWALSGDWTVDKGFVALNQPNGRIAYRFHARDLHLVMSPGRAAMPIRFRVRIDGQPPGAVHGSDVDEQGSGTLTDPRLYQLIRQSRPIADRQFEIEFLDPGAEAFSFTFG